MNKLKFSPNRMKITFRSGIFKLSSKVEVFFYVILIIGRRMSGLGFWNFQEMYALNSVFFTSILKCLKKKKSLNHLIFIQNTKCKFRYFLSFEQFISSRKTKLFFFEKSSESQSFLQVYLHIKRSSILYVVQFITGLKFFIVLFYDNLMRNKSV